MEYLLNLNNMSQIRIGNKIVSHKGELFTIAEIGINHNGSIKIAKLIDKAKQAGFSQSFRLILLMI